MYDLQIINNAIQFYIPQNCQETPPVKKRAGKKMIPAKKNDLTRAVDSFLDRNVPCRHLLILSDSGMGKTTFAINFYLHNQNRPEKKRYKLVLIPLGIQNSDHLIMSVSDKNNTVLFLDDLDGDKQAFQDPHGRLRQLIDQTKNYKRVIITSSIDFIPKVKHLPTQRGYEIIEPKNANDNRLYRFRKLYLSPMAVADAKKILTAYLPFWKFRSKKKIIKYINSDPSLGMAPLLLRYVCEIFPNVPIQSSKTTLYKEVVHKGMDHELHWKDKSLLEKFLHQFARDQFLHWIKEGEESMSKNELNQKAKAWGVTLFPFKSDMQSLLSHGPSGSLKFMHQSILEYLFVEQLISGDKSCYRIPLTGQMKYFFLKSLKNNLTVNLEREFSWLSLFRLQAQGLDKKLFNDKQVEKTPIFESILRKNNQYVFLDRLDKLFKNPIFCEFGWDPKLNKNLENAIFHSKTTLMKLEKKKWLVLINPQEIEIRKESQKNQKLLINNKDFQEYRCLKDEISLITLNREIGLNGLRMLNNINRSKKIVVLPDIKTFKKFTLCFEEELFRS